MLQTLRNKELWYTTIILLDKCNDCIHLKKCFNTRILIWYVFITTWIQLLCLLKQLLLCLVNINISFKICLQIKTLFILQVLHKKSTKNSEQTLEYLLYKCVKNLEKIYRKQRPNCEPTSHIQYKHPIQNLSCYSLEHRKWWC